MSVQMAETVASVFPNASERGKLNKADLMANNKVMCVTFKNNVIAKIKFFFAKSQLWLKKKHTKKMTSTHTHTHRQ